MRTFAGRGHGGDAMKERSSWWRVVLVVVMGLLLGLWWMQTRSAPPVARRPGDTLWGQRLRERRARRVPAPVSKQTRTVTVPDEAPSERPTLVLHVPVSLAEGSVADWRFPIDIGVSIGPHEYWPTLEEAPWPELDSARSLQVLAAALRDDAMLSEDPLQDFLEDAEAEGLLDEDPELDVEDPWRSLLAMQAAHAQAWLTAGDGGIEHAASNRIAEAIIADWPNDPAADYARLHLLQAANDDWSTEHDPETAVRRILDLIEYSDDILVLEVAMSELTRMRDVEMDPASMAQIAAALPEVDPDIQEGIAVLGMNWTVRQSRWDEATHWAEVYGALIEPTCPVGALPSDEQCSAQRQALGAFEARRGREAGTPPTSWQGELSAAVHACVLELVDRDLLETSADAAPLTIEADGEWQAGWVWQRWTPTNLPAHMPAPAAAEAHPLGACLDEQDWEIDPAEPVQLHLFVHIRPGQ